MLQLTISRLSSNKSTAIILNQKPILAIVVQGGGVSFKPIHRKSIQKRSCNCFALHVKESPALPTFDFNIMWYKITHYYILHTPSSKRLRTFHRASIATLYASKQTAARYRESTICFLMYLIYKYFDARSKYLRHGWLGNCIPWNTMGCNYRSILKYFLHPYPHPYIYIYINKRFSFTKERSIQFGWILV